jgi:hypothetical protein
VCSNGLGVSGSATDTKTDTKSGSS